MAQSAEQVCYLLQSNSKHYDDIHVRLRITDKRLLDLKTKT